MNKWIEILLGVVLLNGAIFAWGFNFWNFGEAALNFFRGGLVWMIIFIGLILITLGISDLKN
jgi:predicted phage tail protein